MNYKNNTPLPVSAVLENLEEVNYWLEENKDKTPLPVEAFLSGHGAN